MTQPLSAHGSRRARDGFVLLATLWVVVAVSAVSLALAIMARRTLDRSRNRINERVAYWDAVGCLARANAALTNQLASQPRTSRAQAAALLRAIGGCDLSLTSPSGTLDVNDLSAMQARTLAITAGLTGPQADSAVTTITTAQQRRFTSDSAIATRGHSMLRRSRLLRFLSVDSATVDPLSSPREIRAVLALASPASSGNRIGDAARPPPPDSMETGEWWMVATARAGDPPATLVVRAQIVSFGGSFGVKEYRVE